MGPSPGPARARPGPVHFSRDRARNFEKGPSSTQARDRFLEKGLENWDFYVVKNTGSSRLGIELLWRAWARARLEIDIQGSGSARDRFFRARPITRRNDVYCKKLKLGQNICMSRTSKSREWDDVLDLQVSLLQSKFNAHFTFCAYQTFLVQRLWCITEASLLLL